MNTIVKRQFLILFASLILVGFTPHKSFIIRAGEQVGPFYLEKTSLKEIRQELGWGKLVDKVWLAPHCGASRKYHELKYPKQHISFTFYKEHISSSTTLDAIEIQAGFDGVTDCGIYTFATRQSVQNAHGFSTEKRDTIKNMQYPLLGISFHFSNAVAYDMADSLTSISIYKPIF